MILLAILWAVFIFIVTCTSDVHAFVHDFNVSFTFESNPNWKISAFFEPIEQVSLFEVIGHFFMFFIFTLLLAASIKLRISIVIAVSYTILTEYVQMHFGRGAQLYDIIANLIGVTLALGMVVFGKIVVRKREREYRRTA
ncbi:VanZ family protein [Oceanobacillus salinisoli]|uniref:VanZ family protein n=1 Tax=Oceanobacillus salinisoli TaxID=2678611 RepID=UPI0018CC614B|nr:VanZ family protein [Oceanobacillus salinisoli]